MYSSFFFVGIPFDDKFLAHLCASFLFFFFCVFLDDEFLVLPVLCVNYFDLFYTGLLELSSSISAYHC